MKLKTYHAYSMAEAIAAVKRDLGTNAVILHTRTFKRGGLFGMFRKNIVEVTATPASQQTISPRPAAATPKLKLKGLEAHKAYTTSTRPQRSTSEAKEGSAPSIEHDQQRTRRLAMALQEQHRRAGLDRPNANDENRTPGNSTQPKRNGKQAVTPAPVERAARRFVLTSPDRLLERGSSEKPQNSGNVAVAARPNLIETSKLANSAVQGELTAIKEMVQQVLQRQTNSKSPERDLPQQLFDMYLKLVSQEISNEVADEIIQTVRGELTDEELENEILVRSAVLRRLAEMIPVAQSVPVSVCADGRPFTIALVGPTGVGKTTTLAKLAAGFKLQHNKTVGLVTADTYRIAAVDQLRTYADIIGLPLEVALTPAEMRHALARMRNLDVVLIDTAGRSQKDSGRIAELKRFIAAAEPHEVHMVLSSTASEQVLMAEAEAFSAVGVHKIVLTKLDEAVNFGMLVNVIRRIGKQLSFITTGQEVPDHIEVGRADRLAELVLGDPISAETEVHFSAPKISMRATAVSAGAMGECSV